MLGWEYPPHITGGLATACLGLCEGLHGAGVEVTFVVPRAFGDEDKRFARVLGANQVWVERRDTAGTAATSSTTPTASTTPTPPNAEHGSLDESSSSHTSTPAPTESPTPEQAAPPPIRFIERDPSEEPLSAYADAATFARWRARARLARSVETAPPAQAPLAQRAPAAAIEAATTRENAEPFDERAPLLDAAPQTTSSPARHERFEFRGDYGADLFEEVERYARCVEQLAASEHFDVVHAHDWMTFAAGARAARACNAPLVAHVHASEFDRSGESPDGRIRGVEQMGVDAADLVVCVSHYTAGILRKHYGVDDARLRVVHNAVTRKEQAERVRADKHIAEPIVLFLGRITFQKGPDYFLEAAKRVVAVEPTVKFVMVGAGDMLPKMVERAARMGLARHVHFTGFLRGDDVERIYSMADVYVMPSVSEPFGISPLEALALDTPVIVSRQSGVSEVLANALKVDFWDVDEIANKILALLRYPALREHVLSAGGDEVRAMSWADRGRRLRAVYAELA
jgi:glycosyltransferase involved in cell wall biosynthesis